MIQVEAKFYDHTRTVSVSTLHEAALVKDIEERQGATVRVLVDGQETSVDGVMASTS